MSNKEQPLHTFVTKLGVARQVPKSRIWIEGKRLVESGFTVGQYFVKEWLCTEGEAGAEALRLILVADDDVLSTAPCKVSGKDAKPIIDITGEAVREAFADYEKVTAEFFKGRIVITGHRE